MEFELINFEKYDYNPESCGELVARAECKYRNFYCKTEIVTCLGECNNCRIKSKNTYWHGKNKYNTHRKGKKI